MGLSASSLEQYDITWTFDHTYDYGQFVNGDFWVIADTNDGTDPNVTISSVSPAWTGESHGSMVNPVGFPTAHGYDSRLTTWGYVADSRATYPMTLAAGSSLISTICWIDANSGDPNYPAAASGGAPRPTLRTAAVLTVVASAPDVNDFRPPYAGTVKTSLSWSNVDKSNLLDLAFVGGEPSILTMQVWFRKVWLDHFSHGGDGTQFTSPTRNMPNYGANNNGWCNKVGQGISMLCLDESAIVSADGVNKDTLLKYIIQLGIDTQGVIDSNSGAYWKPNGGLNHGRKWPVLFAGLMLNDATMLAIGTNDLGMTNEGFQENNQTFYIGDREITAQPYTLSHRDPEYNAGTVSVQNGSATVTGSGTSWDVDDANFLWFGVDGDNQATTLQGIAYEISTITDSTHLELKTVYNGSTDSGLTYSMAAWIFYGHGLHADLTRTRIGGDYHEFQEIQRGVPGWAVEPDNTPSSTGYQYKRRYQTTNGKSYSSYALSVLMLGQKTAYNHNPFFDYTDMYIAIAADDSDFDSDWSENMWNAYRTDYGTVWGGKYSLGVYQ